VLFGAMPWGYRSRDFAIASCATLRTERDLEIAATCSSLGRCRGAIVAAISQSRLALHYAPNAIWKSRLHAAVALQVIG
jgi:hypothetical protein